MVPANAPEVFTFSPDPHPSFRTAGERIAPVARYLSRAQRAMGHSVWDQRLAVLRAERRRDQLDAAFARDGITIQLEAGLAMYGSAFYGILNATRAWARARARRDGLLKLEAI